MIVTRFKQPRRKKPSSASKRYGMSKAHLDLVRQLPSCLSGQVPCDPHHLRSGGAEKERGTGIKATDRWAIPLTRGEHIDIHKISGRQERDYLVDRGVNPLELARALWEATGDLDRMTAIVMDNLEGGL